MELIEPVDGDNIFKDFLVEHGEGLHHLGFSVDNIAETTQVMNREGFATLMSFDSGNANVAYYDTVGSLKCIWKAFQLLTKP